MQRVTGLPDDQVTAWEAKLEQQVVDSLQAVMDKIAARIERIQVASAAPRILVAVATTGPTGDDDPPPMTGELAIPDPTPRPAAIPATPDLPPGQPYISPDDLASITPLWQQQVADQVLPLVAQVFLDSAGHVRSQILDAVAPHVLLSVPGLGSVAAEQYLTQARNTFEQVGDHLWATARAQLSEGFDAGESIPQLGARLRQSAGLSARTAVMVARTQVIEASNYGSITMARTSGLQMEKEWIATPDLRTRPTHLAADGQRVALSEPFIVGGYSADFPAAPSLPPAERYGCRCTQGYVMPDRQPALPSRQLDELPGTSRPAIEPRPEPDEGPLTLFYPKAPAPGGAGAGLGELVAAPTKVRPELLRATSPVELTAAWQAQMRAITGRDIIVQLPPDVSVLTMREQAEGVLQMLERFPEARLRKISWFDGADSANYAQVRRGAATIEFNARFSSEAGRRAYLASLRSDVKGWDATPGPGIGWSVRGARLPQATSYHEFAHILSIETLAGARLESRALSVLNRRAALEGIDADTLAARDISAYAGTDGEELIGEAVTDVMVNGPRASAVSREIYDLVVTEYRARGLAVRTSVSDLTDELGAEDLGVDLFPKAAARVAKATKGSTIGDVVRGPTQFEVAMGEADVPSLSYATRAQFEDRALRGAEGVVLHRGERLPADFESRLGDIRRGEFKVRPGLTVEESEALDRYVLSSVADPLNGAWRAGRTPSGVVRVAGRDVDLAEVSERLDSAVAASELAADTALYRGALLRPFDAGKLQVGAVTSESGFLSTTTEQGNAFQIINWRKGRDDTRGRSPVIFKILAPKGTHGAVAHVDEMEVLLGRGRSMRVVDVLKPTRPGDVRVVTVELLPESTVTEAVAAVVAPRALSSQTVAQLRALAKERGITVPAGTRKADLVRMLDEAPPVPAGTAPVSVAVPARVLAARAELERTIASPVVREPYSVGGSSAKNVRVGHEGGDVIVKDYTRDTKAAGVRDADAEELGALVMDALDVPTQTVLRTGERQVTVGVLEGDFPADIGMGLPGPARQALADTDGGRLLGLGDVLIGNSDRRRNFVRLADGRPASFDLGGAFRAPKLAAAADPEGTFAQHFATKAGKAWAPNDMAPADLALIRARLEALKPEFDRLGRATWHNQMMARLVEVEKRATGTRTRLAEAASLGRPVAPGVSGNPALTATKFVPSDEEVAAAMRHYTLDQGYRGVNRSLRGGGGVLSDDVDPYVRRDVAALDRAFAEAKGAKRAVSVTRAIPDAHEIFPDGQIRVGQTWTDEGFVSTSVESGDRLGAVFAGGERPIRMQIVVPKGTKAISAGPYQRRDLLDPDEVLLDRGLTYRVARDNGLDADSIRRIDVEVVPRGTPSAAPPVVGPEVRAMARQATIDERRAVADSLAEARELLANGASERALAHRAGLIEKRTDGAAGDDLAGLVRAMRSGDADQIRVAIGDVAQRRGLTAIDAPAGQDWVPYDPKLHDLATGEARPAAGTFVHVSRPGYSVRLDDGEVVQLAKAKVERLTPEELAAVRGQAAEQSAAAERKAVREAARERNRVIEAQRGTARLLAEVDELAAKGATKTVIRERLDPALREAGQAYAGADSAAADAVSAALDSGDLAKVRAAVTRASTKAKIKPIGRAGAKTTFDPDTMEGVGGIDIAPGAKVTVVRRGSTVPGLTDPLAKAQVTPIAAPVKAVPKVRAKPFEVPSVEAMAERSGVSRDEVAEIRRLTRSLDRPPAIMLRATDIPNARLARTHADSERVKAFAQAHLDIFNRIVQEQSITRDWAEVVAPAFARQGKAMAQVRAESVDKLREAIKDQPIIIRRATESRLRQALDDGRLKTQFETGTSSGILDTEMRANFEGMDFGYGADFPADQRPVYGYIGVGGVRGASDFDGAVSGYGNIQLVLRDSVRPRVTVTAGDSLDLRAFRRPSPIDRIDWRSTGGPDRDYGERWLSSSYIEAQIHGGVTWDDVAEVVFVRTPEPETLAALERRGVAWRVLKPGQT